LAVHLRTLRQLSRDGVAMQGAFPWIGLYCDTLSRVLVGATVVALPLLANMYLLLRILGTQKPVVYWVDGALLLIGLAGVSAYNLILILTSSRIIKVNLPPAGLTVEEEGQ
jgi:hypothetical protein